MSKQNNSKKARVGKAEVGEAKDEEYQKGKVFITFQRLLK